MREILQAEPRAGYRAHKAAIDAAIGRALESGRYILGEEVSAFEQEWARYLGVAHAVGVGNGTDAIELALRALEIGPGDIVITTSNTAVATVAAIELAGASPLLVDVDDATLTIAPPRLEEALAGNREHRIKAVIPVHLYGQPADMPAILALAASHSVRVIEDCAQAHGAAIAGRKVGTFGELTTFSFYPTKNLGALGDGGAVVTNDEALAARLRELRVYGWRERYISEHAGMNTRLDDLQAAILRVKLQFLEAENARRREIAHHYDTLFANLPIRRPAAAPSTQHVYHQYVIRLANRDALRAHLADNGIQTAVLYPLPVHEQPAYAGRVRTAGALTVTERAARELLCLPIHPWLEDAQVERTAGAIIGWFTR